MAKHPELDGHRHGVAVGAVSDRRVGARHRSDPVDHETEQARCDFKINLIENESETPDGPFLAPLCCRIFRFAAQILGQNNRIGEVAHGPAQAAAFITQAQIGFFFRQALTAL